MDSEDWPTALERILTKLIIGLPAILLALRGVRWNKRHKYRLRKLQDRTKRRIDDTE